MNIEKECEQIFDSIRKVLFYVGHGKYNDFMSLEDIIKIKNNLEKILDLEEGYKKSNTLEEKETIYKKLEVFKTFTIKDFLDYKIDHI